MKTIWLSDVANKRDNNFTIIRIVFALLVLVGHAWYITDRTQDPISLLMGGGHVWIGAVAVNGFFAISGYLVLASFFRRDLLDYAISRVLRIYPALIVYIGITVVFLGLFYSPLPWNEFLSHSATRKFISGIFLIDVGYTLPAFSGLNYGSVNGSLWTLPAEIRCYLTVVIVGLAVKTIIYTTGINARFILNITLCGLMGWGYFNYETMPIFGETPRWARPASYFILGCLVYVNKDWLALNPVLAVVMAVAPWLIKGQPGFTPLFAISIVYLIFFCVYYIPSLGIDKFKNADISYGLYLYAWTCQVIVWWPGQTPVVNVLLSVPFTVALAYLSHRFVERPIMERKKAAHTALTNSFKTRMTTGTSLE